MRLLFIIFLSSHCLSLLAQESTLKVYTEKTDKSIFIYADNNQPFPQSVQLKLDLQGLRQRAVLPEFLIVPADSARYLLSELIIPLNKAWGYDMEYSYVMGDVNAEHDDDHVYLLPYTQGKRFRVVQGYQGTNTHMNQNALDFNLPAGETITAARGGKVVKIKEDSNRGCGDRSCANLGNYIIIMHSDGTFGEYYHLQQNGALAEVGDIVSAGEPIGLVGNTGWATGYHLHFLVYKPKPKGRETLVTRFRTKKGIVRPLEEGKAYTSIR